MILNNVKINLIRLSLVVYLQLSQESISIIDDYLKENSIETPIHQNEETFNKILRNQHQIIDMLKHISAQVTPHASQSTQPATQGSEDQSQGMQEIGSVNQEFNPTTLSKER